MEKVQLIWTDEEYSVFVCLRLEIKYLQTVVSTGLQAC